MFVYNKITKAAEAVAKLGSEGAMEMEPSSEILTWIKRNMPDIYEGLSEDESKYVDGFLMNNIGGFYTQGKRGNLLDTWRMLGNNPLP